MTFSTTSPRAAITAADITILPEFQNLIPPLSAEELDQLQNSICADGCIDPLIVWKGKGILLDGHNRYAYCKANGISFKIHELAFYDRDEARNHDAARNWIILNQLGRRNLSPDAASTLRGKLYNAAKKEQGAQPGNSNSKNEGATLAPSLKTAAQIAAKTGVSERTIKNDGAFAEACETLGITQDVMTGKLDAPRAAVIEVAKSLPDNPTPEQVQEAKAKLPHVARNSGENEWYTPPEFIEAAKVVLGTIDLDPASSLLANRVVGANVIFTKDDNGLTKPWSGNVWMNPPYAQPLCARFCERVSDAYDNGEISSAIVLVNNATETQWFQRMLGSAKAVCFPKGRIRFLDPDGKPGAPLQGQAIVYFGESGDMFRQTFGQVGTVLLNGGEPAFPTT